MKSKIKIISTILIIILVVELIVFLIVKINRESNIIYEDNYNDIVVLDDGYVAVGYSNFHNNARVKEEYFEHKLDNGSETVVATKARITKYDNNKQIIWDQSFVSKYNSVFNSVIKVEQGYLAVGYYLDSYSQIDLKTKTGLIVLYDEDGKMLNKKTYQVLSDTSFKKVIEDDNNYIIVGQSIYENMEIGNHITGGGIIVKVNKDLDIIEENNYGGTKSAIFNDVIAVSDGYIVCGKDAINYGIIVKFPKKFNRDDKDRDTISNKIIWHRNYENTDEVGFTSLLKKDNKIYVSGGIASYHENETFYYDTGYVIYNDSGKYLDTVMIGGSKTERFNDILLDDNYIILVGSTNSNDFNKMNISGEQVPIIALYDYENKIVNVYHYELEGITILNQIAKSKDGYIVVGTTAENSDNDYHALLWKMTNELKKIN